MPIVRVCSYRIGALMEWGSELVYLFPFSMIRSINDGMLLYLVEVDRLEHARQNVDQKVLTTLGGDLTVL